MKNVKNSGNEWSDFRLQHSLAHSSCPTLANQLWWPSHACPVLQLRGSIIAGHSSTSTGTSVGWPCTLMLFYAFVCNKNDLEVLHVHTRVPLKCILVLLLSFLSLSLWYVRTLNPEIGYNFIQGIFHQKFRSTWPLNEVEVKACFATVPRNKGLGEL